MKHTMAGVVALVVTAGLAASCGGSISTVNGSPGDEAGSQDGTPGCGGSGEPCCNGATCNSGLACGGGRCGGSSQADATMESGGDVAVADVTVDTRPGPGAGDGGENDASVDSAGDVVVADVAGDATSAPEAGDASVSDALNVGCTLPGEVVCSGQTALARSTDGQWHVVPWCDYCGPCVCVPGVTQCSGNGLETCTVSGTWGSAVPCVNSACVNGGCTGVCTPGSTQCSGTGVQACSSSCTWGVAVACVNQSCVAGACIGSCTPGSVRCSDGGVEACDPTGTWQSAAFCDGGSCDGGGGMVACTGDVGQSE